MPYLLRNYTASFPNQVWFIDITYIPMPHGHMYLTAMIDWYSRRIVGHYLSDTLDTDSVIHAVKETIKHCGIPAIINSDQGCQFTSDAYKKLLCGLKIRQSMDGRSRWADNIMIERWFRSLKTEQLYPNEYTSIIGGGDVIRTSVICFYLSNEGISIMENAVRIGLPVPRKLRAVLRHLRIKGDK